MWMTLFAIGSIIYLYSCESTIYFTFYKFACGNFPALCSSPSGVIV